MKAIVATTRTQGQLDGDFAWTLDGELVHLPGLECTSADSCGCGWSFCGVASHRATSTAEVAERELDEDTVIDAVAQSLVDAGWFGDPAGDGTVATAVELVGPLLLVARELPVGTVVRRSGDRLYVRA